MTIKEVLQPVSDEIRNQGIDLFHHTWNKSAMAVDISLTIEEARNLVRLHRNPKAFLLSSNKRKGSK